jgi:hypothetical protein
MATKAEIESLFTNAVADKEGFPFPWRILPPGMPEDLPRSYTAANGSVIFTMTTPDEFENAVDSAFSAAGDDMLAMIGI